MDRQIAFNPDKNQSSQGGLKYSQNIKSISSQAVIAELDILKIQPFLQIPDYNCPTISPVPIVVISPISCTCIDGWDFIQKAKFAGHSKVDCHAFYIPDHCETEIAIRKVAIRTMPQGGNCSYAELVRNAGILFKMLMASTTEPVVFSHGGQRRGPSYTENGENDVRKLLANRLGKSVTTISKYLNHGEHLNNEAIEALIIAGIDKGFFEAFQPYKRKIIADLKSAQTNEIELTSVVSEAVLVVLQEYSADKQTAASFTPTGQNEHSPSPSATSRDLERRSSSKPQKIFQHWNGSDHPPEELHTTENDVYREIKGVSRHGVNGNRRS
jgi:hypothetical protein